MKKLFALIFTLLFSFSLFSCAKETSDERIERISEIDMPSGMEEVYSFTDKTFTGVAGQYSVYSIDYFDINGYFSKLTDGDIENINVFLTSLEIPDEYRPDFDNEYYFTIGNETTYVIYFPNEKLLKVCLLGH